MVTRFVGTKDSLSSERAYTLRTLPSGVLYNLALALLEMRFCYMLRVLAIVAGFCITAAGYVAGKYALRPSCEDVKTLSKMNCRQFKDE